MVAALDRGKCVRRLAKFSQSDAAGMYREHDILVHPKYMDPCPTVVLEALACGLPVAGSVSGGMPEMVDESCGVLVPAPRDWNERHTPGGVELAGAIEKIHANLESMSAAARRLAVERFSVEPWVEAHRRIFTNLLR